MNAIRMITTATLVLMLMLGALICFDDSKPQNTCETAANNLSGRLKAFNLTAATVCPLLSTYLPTVFTSQDIATCNSKNGDDLYSWLSQKAIDRCHAKNWPQSDIDCLTTLVDIGSIANCITDPNNL